MCVIFLPVDTYVAINVFMLLYCMARWLDALFCLGCRRDLNQSDLYAHPDEADSEKLERSFKKLVCSN